MPINMTCTCGRKLQIRDEYAGREGKCPACGGTLQIPFPEDTRAPVPEARVVHLTDPEDVNEEEGPLLDHGGAELSSEADFFVDAPAGIGPILSAHTTLLLGKNPMSSTARLLACAAAGAAGLTLGGIIDLVFEPNEFFTVIWPGLGLLAGAGITFASTRFNHTCTYVGREGVARFACSGTRENVSTSDLFRFRDATDLRTAQTVHYYNGAYTHTSYSFAWSDVGGRTRYTISGQHKNRDGNPPTTDFYHFGRAAELAWTYYLFEQVYRKLHLAGSVQFNLNNGQWVRLGPDLVVFGLSREPIECPANDLAGCTIQKGVVCLRRHDATEGWFSSSGVYKFNFSDLANAQLFFHVLEKVVRVPVS